MDASRGKIHAQWSLIEESVNAQVDGRESAVVSVQNGDFLSVLSSREASSLLQQFASALGGHLQQGTTLDFTTIHINLPDEQNDRFFPQLLIAIAALHAFVQANWTGPNLPVEIQHLSVLLRRAAPDSFGPRSLDDQYEQGKQGEADSALHTAALNALTWGGEPAYHLCEVPFLLLFSLRILEALLQKKDFLETVPWWSMRAQSVHSRILDIPMPLSDAVLARVDELELEMNEKSDQDPIHRNLHARLLAEKGLALQRSGKEKEANELLVLAAQANQLQYEMTGAMGKRTKFQKEDKMILVLKAESHCVPTSEPIRDPSVVTEDEKREEYDEGPASLPGESSNWKASIDHSKPSDMPSEMLHNDDTLLERTRFTSSQVAYNGSAASLTETLANVDISQPTPLDPLDAAILLGLCLNIGNTSPENGLTASEMSAFVSRVLAHARNWSVHTMALLLRSRLEAHRTRTAQRSALQLQALVDQMPSSDSSLAERLRYFHTLELPSKWDMQAELAGRYASLGVIRSALEIYERIELWQEVVHCWGALGRQDKGIEVIRDLLLGRKLETEHAITAKKMASRDEQTNIRLNTARNAKLWCLLGDLEVEHAEEHYTKAWEVSGRSSARAARSLGGMAFSTGDLDKAIVWLQRGLRIQPLLSRSWFMLGCAYMRLDSNQGWLEAARCFRRCTSLDDEDSESWNNLASVYLRLGQQSQGVLRDAARADATDGQYDQQAVLGNEDDDAASGYSSDSGIGMATSSGSDTETEGASPDRRPRTVTEAVTAGGGTGAFDVKLLAHRALLKALRFSHDDWRVWNNLMIVSVDCGMMSDAVRSMERVVTLRSTAGQPNVEEQKQVELVDVAVLNRIVDAVTRAPSDAKNAIEEQSDDLGNPSPSVSKEVQHNPHEGHGLRPAVENLFTFLLSRITSSAAIWRTYARFLFWRGRFRSALEAHLSAWRVSYGAEGSDMVTNREEWINALDALQELTELLENFGDRNVLVTQQGDECDAYDSVQDKMHQKAMANWQFRARSLVRTFIGRTKDTFESDPEWDRLLQIRDSLSPSRAAV